MNSHGKAFQFCNMLPFLLFPKLKNLVGFRTNSRGSPWFFGLPIKLAQTMNERKSKFHCLCEHKSCAKSESRPQKTGALITSWPPEEAFWKTELWWVWVVSDVWRSPLIHETVNVDFFLTTALKRKVSLSAAPVTAVSQNNSTIYSKTILGWHILVSDFQSHFQVLS